MSLGLFKKRPSKGPSTTGENEKFKSSVPTQSQINKSSPPLQSLPRHSNSRPPSSGALELSPALAKVHLDDWGRSISPSPAFRGGEEGDVEMQLLYGYAVIHTASELSISAVDLLVTKCGHEIMTRGLDSPLIFSSTALDISMEGTSSLIRSYMADPLRWAYDLNLAAPLDVGSFMKWGLARLINEKGGRGFLSWDLYNEFKVGEQASAYPPRFCASNLIGRLPKANAHLLAILLSLFSSVAAHSIKNGMTPRRLASLFSPYIFGLADDQPFDVTYVEWQRATDAAEHILLSFIRGQEEASGRLPTHLEKFILGYPQVLNISYSLSAAPKIPRGGRVEEVTRVRRLARFHSRNLISTAATWEVPHCPDWKLFFPLSPSAPQTIIYTPFYRHLLNIRSGVEGDDDDEGEMQRYKSIVDKEWSKFGELGFKGVDPQKLEFDLSESERNKTRAKHDTMDWRTFEQSGFGGRETFTQADMIFKSALTQSVQTWPASQQALDQRLRQTEKMLPPFPYDVTPYEQTRILVDVNFFEVWADVLVAGGWARDELKESSFALVQWKSRPRDGEFARGRSAGNDSDDRTEERWVLVEEYVPREYREELRDGKKKSSKRVSFLRSVRRKKESPARLNVNQVSYPSSTNTSPSTMFAPSPTPTPRQIDESVFNSGSGGNTRHLTLSAVNVNSTYAPSFISSTGAGHGHVSSSVSEEPYEPFEFERRGEYETKLTKQPLSSPLTYTAPSIPPPIPPPSSRNRSPIPPSSPVSRSPKDTLHHGVGGAISSQKRESAFKTSGKPPPIPGGSTTKGFLARIGSRKNKTSPTSPYGFGVGPPLPQALESVESYGYAADDSTTTLTAAPPLVPIPPTSYPPNQSNSSLGPPPPTPPKTEFDHSPQQGNGFPAPQINTYSPTTASYTTDNRASNYTTSTDDDDPYGGIDDDESVREGTVLFRGSRSYPRDLSLELERGGPGVEVAPPVVRRLPIPPTITTPATGALPLPIPLPTSNYGPRHDSLPPSPKPDADAPIDESNRTRDKFSSGASAYSTASRVSNLAARFEVRDTSSNNGDVRLTQYGFGGGVPAALGRVNE